MQKREKRKFCSMFWVRDSDMEIDGSVQGCSSHKSCPQERISERIMKHFADVPAPQNLEKIFDLVRLRSATEDRQLIVDASTRQNVKILSKFLTKSSERIGNRCPICQICGVSVLFLLS